MRVSSSSAIGGGQVSPARKAQLEKQIQKLEKQKRRLQKKLRGESTSSSQTQTPSFENAKVTMGSGGDTTVVPRGSSPAVVANTSAAPSATGDGSTAAALPKTTASRPASASVSAVMEVISSFKGLSQAESSGVEDMIDDPKEIMKQIMLLEQQIMMLKQQLGEEPKIKLDDDDKKPPLAIPGAPEGERAAVEAAPLPTPDVGTDGHVDGYV